VTVPFGTTVPFLDRPLDRVLGLRSAQPLAKHLGLATVDDLLRHYPRRYIERGELTALGELREGEEVTVLASVLKVERIPMRGRRGKVVKAVITDGKAQLDVSFFAPKPWMEARFDRELRPGRRLLFAGKVGSFRGRRQLTHPEMEAYDAEDGEDVGAGADRPERAEQFAEQIRPIYPASAKVQTWKIAKAVGVLLDTAELADLADPLPEWVRERRGLMPWGAALRAIHRPVTEAEIAQARARLTYDEAFILQVALAGRRAEVAAQPAIPRTGQDEGLLAAFDARLPFRLTEGQVEVSAAIQHDLARDHPMHRLLQGEVGSGKTVVALRAMLTVVDAGGQAALLAPTEVLAQQHHRSITAMMGDLAEGGMLGGHPHGTQVRLMTGSQSAGARAEALEDARSGEAGIVIGTHALLQDRVEFRDLGLVVVDEQHRFGVEQRAALTDKAGWPPHVLVMTATPIPRTVAMTVFGDLEVSTLTELPAGRAPIQTNVVPLAEQPGWVGRVWQRVREEVEKGHQAYVVCPRITGDELEEGESDSIDINEDGELVVTVKRSLSAVTEVVEELTSGPLAGLRVEMLHGKLLPDDKDRVMRAFAAGEVDVLVSTTVIEVGVDVANATTMVLLDADRFGISQLHQMRGRVGRGGLPGLCLLVSHAEVGSPARERLDAVAATTDGFELSRLDLDQRREGDVLGRSQSGFRSSLTMLRVLRDEDTIVAARRAATALLERDPDLASAPALSGAVAEMEQSRQSDFMEKA
jgi:ATP-dependent DNA helicase RecG